MSLADDLRRAEHELAQEKERNLLLREHLEKANHLISSFVMAFPQRGYNAYFGAIGFEDYQQAHAHLKNVTDLLEHERHRLQVES